MFRRLRARLRWWRNRRFLKKNGCETWRQYRRRNDPDVCQWASRVTDYFHGYKYVTCLENNNHIAYYWDIGRDGIYVLSNWCDANCIDKYRFEFLRVLKQTPIGLSGPEESEWWINEIGGRDYIFVAFKNEQDSFLFNLRWGS